MEAAFQMVRQVVVFLLLAALLTNLFMGTEYKKYFTYVTSLIVILLVLVPVLGFFGKGKVWEKNYILSENKQQVEQTKEEIRLLGEKYEKQTYEINSAVLRVSPGFLHGRMRNRNGKEQ